MTPGTSPDSARRALLLTVALALAGCGLTRPAPVKETYLLEPPPPPAVAKPQPTSIRVGVVNVAAPFRGRGLVYRASELRYETDYYQEFLIPPSTMLTELTSRALERSKAFARVVPPGSASSADWELNGFVSALYVDIRDNAKPAAEIAISFYLFAGNRAQEMPAWTRDYQRRAPVPTQTAQAYAAALNAALGEIFTELTRDLATAELKRN
jgi:cholesterol transport system auxiliary component